MVTIGICSKCGKEGVVRQHHYKGYTTDETTPYCLSCDFKAHNKARRDGRCILSGKESKLLSDKSSGKRNKKIKMLFSYTPEKHSCVKVSIIVNKNTLNYTLNSTNYIN